MALIAVSVPGILDVIAKDHVSRAEGVLAWASIVALLAGLVALLVAIVGGVRMLARSRS